MPGNKPKMSNCALKDVLSLSVVPDSGPKFISVEKRGCVIPASLVSAKLPHSFN